MDLFSPISKQTAYGKVALFGFPKSGKTFTAAKIAIGLAKRIKSEKPVAFIDTEGGVDYVEPLFRKEKLDLLVARTRAFKDHQAALKEAERKSDILIFDSATHSWEDVQESYKKKKQKTSLAFQDWGIIKPTFAELANYVLASKLHVILCIRAGWEWDYFENEEGKMELHKIGTKMRMEAQFGYEPSLLVEMERCKNEDAKTKRAKQFTHRAWVLGDRADVLDGKYFDNPSFKDFEPHFNIVLKDSSSHAPVDLTRDSQDLFNSEGKPQWKYEAEGKELARAEIRANIDKYFPSSSAKEKKAKILLKEHIFNVRSDEGLEPLDLQTLKIGQEYLDWLLKDAGVVNHLLNSEETVVQAILKGKKGEWEVYNSNQA